MKTIAIVNRRGGVGKTVTAHAVGAGLSLRGYKTLFVDLDSQCNLTYDVGGKSAPLTSMEVLSGTATAQDAIQHTQGGDIIPASPSLAVADTAIDGTGKEYRLKEALEPLAGQYDFVVIDTPPALGVLTINALTASASPGAPYTWVASTAVLMLMMGVAGAILLRNIRNGVMPAFPPST